MANILVHLFFLKEVITMVFELPALPYSYDALEPHYDAETV